MRKGHSAMQPRESKTESFQPAAWARLCKHFAQTLALTSPGSKARVDLDRFGTIRTQTRKSVVTVDKLCTGDLPVPVATAPRGQVNLISDIALSFKWSTTQRLEQGIDQLFPRCFGNWSLQLQWGGKLTWTVAASQAIPRYQNKARATHTDRRLYIYI